MRSLKTFLVIITAALTINSCCKKRGIPPAKVEFIEFYNFNQQDLDTIVVEWYNKDSLLAPPVDSTIIIPHFFPGNTAYELVGIDSALSLYFDYKIRLVSTGRIFTLSDLISK